MKTVDKLPIESLDMTPAIPLLDAIETAESFSALFAYTQANEHDINAEEAFEEAMEVIEEYCPWLWPAIDRAVLSIVRSLNQQ